MSSTFNPVFTRLVTFFNITPNRKAIDAPMERRKDDLARIERNKETKGFPTGN